MKKFTPKQEALKKEVLKRVNALTHAEIESKYWDVNTSMGPLSDHGMVKSNTCTQSAIDFYNAWVNESDDLTDAITDAWQGWFEVQVNLIEQDPEEYGYEQDDLVDGEIPYDMVDQDGWVGMSIELMSKVIIEDVMYALDWKRAYSIARKRLQRNSIHMHYSLEPLSYKSISDQALVVINDIKWEQPESLYINIKYA